MLIPLDTAYSCGNMDFPCQAPTLKRKQIGWTDDVPVALAKPFQLYQTGDVGGVFGGTTGHRPGLCSLAVMQKMLAGHGVILHRRLSFCFPGEQNTAALLEDDYGEIIFCFKKAPPCRCSDRGAQEKYGSEKIIPGNCSDAVRVSTILHQAARTHLLFIS